MIEVGLDFFSSTPEEDQGGILLNVIKCYRHNDPMIAFLATELLDPPVEE